MGESSLDAAALEGMVMRVNKDKFLSVKVPGAAYSVLLTPEGQLDGDDGMAFLDPRGQQALVIAHAEQRCTGVRPLDGETSAECEGAESQVQPKSTCSNGNAPDSERNPCVKQLSVLPGSVPSACVLHLENIPVSTPLRASLLSACGRCSFGMLFLSCACVSVSGVLFSVGVCVCDLLIFLHSG